MEKQVELPARLGRTDVTYRPAREILTRATGFIGGYDFTLNPYSGCGFACTYCYAAFFTRSQEQRDRWGLWVNAKENAARLLGELGAGGVGRKAHLHEQRHRPLPAHGEKVGTDPIRPGGPGGPPPAKARRPDPQPPGPPGRGPLPGDREKGRTGPGQHDRHHRRRGREENLRARLPVQPSPLKAVGKVQEAGVQSCITLTPLLLVRDPEAFADTLIATRVEKFIAQTFHFQTGEFVAQTRQAALDIMAEKLAARPKTSSPGTWNTTGGRSVYFRTGCRNWRGTTGLHAAVLKSRR